MGRPRRGDLHLCLSNNFCKVSERALTVWAGTFARDGEFDAVGFTHTRGVIASAC